MWSWLIGLIPFVGKLIDPILAITKQIIEWEAKRLDAQTEQQRIEAEENIAVLQAQRDVMIAEAQYNARTNNLIRLGFVIPCGLYVWKYFVWDKVLNYWTNGTTDPINSDMRWILFAVIGFYFIQNIARIVAKPPAPKAPLPKGLY